jgi:hypothetical protein
MSFKTDFQLVSYGVRPSHISPQRCTYSFRHPTPSPPAHLTFLLRRPVRAPVALAPEGDSFCSLESSVASSSSSPASGVSTGAGSGAGSSASRDTPKS